MSETYEYGPLFFRNLENSDLVGLIQESRGGGLLLGDVCDVHGGGSSRGGRKVLVARLLMEVKRVWLVLVVSIRMVSLTLVLMMDKKWLDLFSGISADAKRNTQRTQGGKEAKVK